MSDGWTYDPARGCYDHETAGCVAKDRDGAKPWAAYYGGNSASPKSLHRTMRAAMAACEAAKKGKADG